jgi:3-dehydroquinate dehydratase I
MAQVVSSRTLFSSPTPLVVGVVASGPALTAFSQYDTQTEACDLCELRLDMIGLPEAEVRALAARIRVPLILTARHPDEGGHGELDAAARTALIEAHLDRAALIDIELRSALELQALIKKAQSRRIGVLGSFHDFSGTPSDDILRGATDLALQFNLDAAKLATTLRGPGDLAQLLQLLESQKRIPLSVMGMGALGRVSRLVLAKCGSVLNYGHLGESNAPGQWPARQLKELLRDL